MDTTLSRARKGGFERSQPFDDTPHDAADGCISPWIAKSCSGGSFTPDGWHDATVGTVSRTAVRMLLLCNFLVGDQWGVAPRQEILRS